VDVSSPGHPLPPFFSVGRTFSDQLGVLDEVWASASGREARLYRGPGGEPVLAVDGQPLMRGVFIENVFFSPDGRRVLILRSTREPGLSELVEGDAILCAGSNVTVWFAPDGAHWALRFCDVGRDEVCQVDGAEVFRTRWDHYMGGSDWEPPWIRKPEP
jgi:hypothetical protein